MRASCHVNHAPLPRPPPTRPAEWSCDRGCFNPQPNFRYIASATLVDWSGQEYATLFDGEAKAVLGIDANELQAAIAHEGGEANGLPPAMEARFKDVTMKEFLMTAKARLEERGGEQRVKVTVVKVRELDPVRESRAVISSLHKYVAAAAAGGGH